VGINFIFALEIEQRWVEGGQHQCAYSLEGPLCPILYQTIN
jgi:hypothetical protein